MTAVQNSAQFRSRRAEGSASDEAPAGSGESEAAASPGQFQGVAPAMLTSETAMKSRRAAGVAPVTSKRIAAHPVNPLTGVVCI